MTEKTVVRTREPAAMFLLVAAASIFTTTAVAQDVFGAKEFRRSCAVCHGESARGDGPLAELLGKKPADLTQMTKNNNGKFPLEKIYKAIDGRWEINAHGPAAMPVWGDVYELEAAERYGPAHADTEAMLRGRILELVYFIQSRQED